MKRLFILFVCLWTGVVSCPGKVVPQERAEGVASAFFRQMTGGTKSAASGTVRLVATFPEVKTKVAATEPTIYVFEHTSGGYVLVSGEEAGRPVLAYSLSGRFPALTEIPVNMRDMLDFYSAVLYRARVMGWKPDAAVRAEWDAPTKAAEGTPVQLETAKWNQWSPYNDLCPKIKGQEVPCGCVATAMGIIMRYHKWPEQGSGTLPAYDYGWDNGKYQYHMEGQVLGHRYNWDAMSASGNFSQEGRSQVARLMLDLGIMSRMDYDPEGSGASGMAPLLLAKYFDYDKQMRYYDRIDGFTDVRWEAIIRNEIDANRPVFHCGASSRGGHAFVIDGYNGRYFSINYGWGGADNAFYTLVPVEGHEADLTEFSSGQDMVCQIMPNQGGTPYVNLFAGSAYSAFTWDFRSPSFVSSEVLLSIWSDASTGNGPTDLCYCLYDRSGNLKEVLSETVTFYSEEPEGIFPSVTCKAPSQVENGDVIQLSRPDELAGWIPIRGNRMGRVEFDRERPLSEMVSLGHSFGYPWDVDVAWSPCFFFRVVKDIYWEIRRVPDGQVLVKSSQFLGRLRTLWDNEAYYALSPVYSDYLRERVDHAFALPAGEEYELYFRNFDDEMTLRVVL